MKFYITANLSGDEIITDLDASRKSIHLAKCFVRFKNEASKRQWFALL